MNILAPHPYVLKLEKALDRMGGLYLPQDILAAVKQGKMQLFALNDSVAITQIADFPRAKVLEIVVAVGDLDELRALHDEVLKYAERIGASIVQAYGRDGWFTDAIRRGWKVKTRSFLFQREL